MVVVYQYETVGYLLFTWDAGSGAQRCMGFGAWHCTSMLHTVEVDDDITFWDMRHACLGPGWALG